MLKKRIIPLILLLLFFTSCATYYQKHEKFNRLFEAGKIEKAEKLLADDQKSANQKARILFFFNRGVVHNLLGDHAQSNEFFEKGIRAHEDYIKNYFQEAAALVSNPMMLEYRGEYFEILLAHYYKALNYIHLNNYEAALIECRRMNIKLNEFSDFYRSDNKFSRDAFIHNLMGIIYEASGDMNNAFIAYRNAYQIYNDDYSRLFSMKVPEQLKIDLIRSAHRNGFINDAKFYEKEFGMNYEADSRENGNVVFFWHNGLGPVKTEWGLNFVILRKDGIITFYNEQFNLTFAFPVKENETEASALGNLEVLRVAFPKYVERVPVYDRAQLSWNGKTFPMYLGEDVNKIAFKSLNDRFLREMGNGLLRMGVKKSAEHAIRQENQDIGAVVGILNAVTEKADTRNWQTLPHSIYYSRLSLPAGQQEVTFTATNSRNRANVDQNTFVFNVRQGRTVFQTYHTIETLYRQY